MLNGEVTMRPIDRLFQRATVFVAIMELLLACAPVDGTTVGEGSRQSSEVSGQMIEGNDYQNHPLPMCNVRDNRMKDSEGKDDCTEIDNRQHTIAIKVVTKDDPDSVVEEGQTFLCQCGEAKLETVLGTVPGDLDEVESIAITSQNPTCLVWSRVGGKKECVLWASD